jgi:hypothetical protein
VRGGWQQKLQGYLQGQVIVLEDSLGRLHPAEDQVCLEEGQVDLEEDLFWMHGKIAS